MQIKCGTDLVLDKRILDNLSNSIFINRIYHKSEIFKNNSLRSISIFALKEAVFKALDISSDNWLEVEINYSSSGKPFIILSNKIKPQGLVSLDCSVSHAGGFTTAIVFLLLN